MPLFPDGPSDPLSVLSRSASGDLFVLESEVFHSRCSDHEETGRECGRRGPRALGLWSVAATGRALPALAWRLCVAPRQAWDGHRPEAGASHPSRSLLDLAFLNASALRLRKGVARPPSPALRKKRPFRVLSLGLPSCAVMHRCVQGHSRDTGTSLARSQRERSFVPREEISEGRFSFTILQSLTEANLSPPHPPPPPLRGHSFLGQCFFEPRGRPLGLCPGCGSQWK